MHGLVEPLHSTTDSNHMLLTLQVQLPEHLGDPKWNKTKYLRLRLNDEVSLESLQTWDRPLRPLQSLRRVLTTQMTGQTNVSLLSRHKYAMLYFLSILISCVFRVSILDVSSQVGWIIGNYSSAIVFKTTGFNGIYGLTGALLCLNLFYTFFFLKESRY